MLSRILVAAGAICAAGPCLAVEGRTAAGPIGGTDVRSALLPPPGIYGGMIFLRGNAHDFRDGNGAPIPGLDSARLTANIGGAFLVYVPEVQIFGGSIGFLGVQPFGVECG